MELVVKHSSKEHWDLLITTLINMGYIWHRNGYDTTNDIKTIKSKWYVKYPSIVFNTKTKNISGRMKGGNYTVQYDLYAILKHINGLETVDKIAVNNVGSYRAIVTSKEIVVGCQTISGEKFREIMETVKTVRGN